MCFWRGVHSKRRSVCDTRLLVVPALVGLGVSRGIGSCNLVDRALQDRNTDRRQRNLSVPPSLELNAYL